MFRRKYGFRDLGFYASRQQPAATSAASNAVNKGAFSNCLTDNVMANLISSGQVTAVRNAWGMIVPTAATPFGNFMKRQFLSRIPITCDNNRIYGLTGPLELLCLRTSNSEGECLKQCIRNCNCQKRAIRLDLENLELMCAGDQRCTFAFNDILCFCERPSCRILHQATSAMSARSLTLLSYTIVLNVRKIYGKRAYPPHSPDRMWG